MRVRFDAFPAALRVLAGWRAMPPEARRLICHFHVQLTDPLYRAFTGEFLPERRDALRLEVHRQTVIQWAAEHGPSRWALKTQLQFASRLLSCAGAAGLLRGTRDPREVVAPRVPDARARVHPLHAARAPVPRQPRRRIPTSRRSAWPAVTSPIGCARCRTIELRQVGDVHELDWRYPDLEAWAPPSSSRRRRRRRPRRLAVAASAAPRAGAGMTVPRTQLDEAFAALARDLVHEDGPRISTMRNYRYAIVPYDPADEFKLREHVQRPGRRAHGTGWVVLSISLHKLLLQRIRAPRRRRRRSA